MKIQLAGRPSVAAFDLDPGQVFIHESRVYVAVAPGRLADGKPFNAVSLATGTLFHFAADLTVELLQGTFVEDDLSSEVEI